MRITRLEIFGFKSFRDRFVLNFDRNIIGIVGPNGCGKSNIVDALRWILGETHAKHLRGEVLEDLIFNGSDSHRALGMAEVSITIRPEQTWSIPRELVVVNDPKHAAGREHSEGDVVPDEVGSALLGEQVEGDRGIPTSVFDIPGLFDAAEIQLTRRLYRSGESEYFINRTPCRLRDMVELYRLIGLGARGLSVVQQGQIGQIISRKPQELRELLEEAAGISGFRARIETAQRKLDQTRENLARLTDIIVEVEKHARQLKRQAARARVRNEMKSQLSAVERELFETRSLLLLEARREAEVELERSETALAENRARFARGSSAEVEKRAKLDELDAELASLRGQREEIAIQINAERMRQNEARIVLARSEAELRAKQGELERIAARALGLRSLLEREDELEQELTDRVAVVRSRLEVVEGELAALAEPRESNEESGSCGVSPEACSEIEALTREIESLRLHAARLDVITEEIRELEERVVRVRAALHARREQLSERRLVLTRTESELENLRRRIEVLSAQVRERVTDDGVGDGDGKLLFLSIRTPPELEIALAAVLRERAEFMILDDLQRAAESYASRTAAARSEARIGVIERGAPAGVNVARLLSAVGPAASRLVDEVEVAPEYRSAVEALLGSALLVESLRKGLELRDRVLALEGEWMFVTRRGEVVTRWGWYTTEGDSVQEELRLSALRELEAREGRAEALRHEIEELLPAVRMLEDELQGVEGELRGKLAEREGLLQLERNRAALIEKRSFLESQNRSVRVEEERRAQAELLARERRLQGEVRQLSSEYAQLESVLNASRSKRAEANVELVELAQRRRVLEEEVRAADREIRELKDRILRGDSEEASRVRWTALQDELKRVEHAIREVEERRGEVRRGLAEEAEELAALRTEGERISEEVQKWRLAVERRDVELMLLLEEVRKQYPEIESLPASDSLLQIHAQAEGDLVERVAELGTRACQLRRRLDREGEVDPQAIELYEAEQARLDVMRRQFEDLDTASKTLHRTIYELKEVSRSRFLETFESVSAKFEHLVPRLFGGGAGKMHLSNPEDPLTSGVVLSVRPPGKHLRTLELLSGGEKALAATAVVVAMFLHRPSPICVLDEVDAPLDDANLERFLTLVREISASTQFLVITHNKLTMAAADRLVGITMQEKGISTALSVTFEDAERVIESGPYKKALANA